MSVNPPVLTIALGTVGIPQADVIEAVVYLGATKEVSSWELRLQNWDGKYSPNGTYPLNVGRDGYICIGRGADVPQLITVRTESLKFQSTPTEHYVVVAGRCWGEKLFRQTVTKDYSGFKGEEIVKDLLDYYSGLSHVRGSTELVENTDTTFTDLKVQETQVWDLLQKIASESDKNGVIGYDFRIAPDGKFEFFPRGNKTSFVSLTDKIETNEYRKEIIAVRNKVTIYGAQDKSVPLNKVDWSQSLTPTVGSWAAATGVVSLETAMGSPYCIKLFVQNNNVGGVRFLLNGAVNANLYCELHFAIQKESYFDGRSAIVLWDNSSHSASRLFAFQSPGNGGVSDQWTSESFRVGALNGADWSVMPGFDWSKITQVAFFCYPVQVTGSGSFWVDKLYFGGLRYSSFEQDAASQAAFGLREYVDVDEELWSDTECLLRARAILANMKDAAEYITLKSTVIDYGNTPLFAADIIAVSLPNENVNGNFRILSAEYRLKSEIGELEILLELGREKALLADYLYALRSKVDHVNRYKVARL